MRALLVKNFVIEPIDIEIGQLQSFNYWSKEGHRRVVFEINDQSLLIDGKTQRVYKHYTPNNEIVYFIISDHIQESFLLLFDSIVEENECLYEEINEISRKINNLEERVKKMPFLERLKFLFTPKKALKEK